MVAIGLKLGALAGAVLILLIPTFNALNAAHLEGLDPPFRVDPPPDVEPPEDLEDLDVPEEPPPPEPVCRRMVTRDTYAPAERFGGSFSPSPLARQSGAITETIPRGTVGVAVLVNFTMWRGDFVVGPVQANGEDVEGGEGERAVARADDPPRAEASWSVIVPLDEAPSGRWTAAFSYGQISGNGSIQFVYRTVRCADGEAPT